MIWALEMTPEAVAVTLDMGPAVAIAAIVALPLSALILTLRK